MKLLVVEDEPKTGNYRRLGPTEASFVVDLVRHGNDGLHWAVTDNYDLIVLDVMLPECTARTFPPFEVRNRRQRTTTATAVISAPAAAR
jgi:DNA-binding response OmpR family regulator